MIRESGYEEDHRTLTRFQFDMLVYLTFATGIGIGGLVMSLTLWLCGVLN